MPRKAPVPSHTQAPNVFYDEWIKEINSLAELKVVEVVIRNTFGWHVERVKMSLADIKTATGLSKSSTQDGVRRAIKDGYISRVANGRSFAYEIPVDVPESGTCQNDESIPDSGTRSYRDSVRSADLSINVLKKEKKTRDIERPTRPEAECALPFKGSAFQTVFSEFELYCRQKRKAVTGIARQKLFAKLAKYPEDVVVEALNESMANRWTGVFPEKVRRNSNGGNGSSNSRPGWMAAEK